MLHRLNNLIVIYAAAGFVAGMLGLFTNSQWWYGVLSGFNCAIAIKLMRDWFKESTRRGSGD
jgi:hypothetical protein